MIVLNLSMPPNFRGNISDRPVNIYLCGVFLTLNSSTLCHQVNSNFGADGWGNYMSTTGDIQVGNYMMNYAVYQVYGASNDASICEVFYSISSTVS